MPRIAPLPEGECDESEIEQEAAEASPVAAPQSAVLPGAASVADDFEPQTDSAAMPAWLFVVLIALTYWGMIHLDRYGGGFNEFVYGPYQSYRQLADLSPKSGPEMLVAKGESVYGTLCVACHQLTGLGSPDLSAPGGVGVGKFGVTQWLIRIPLHG